MGLYELPLSMSLLGFEMGTMLANFHMYGIRLVLRAVFNMLVRNASPRGLMCFRCLMFSLSGPYELLILLYFIASWTRGVASVKLYPCILRICLSCVKKQFAICLGVVLILLLNVMEEFSVGGSTLLNTMVSK